MKCPIREDALLRIVERVEIPCVNEQGALIEDRDTVLEDVKTWIEDIDGRAYYIPGGVELFLEDLSAFLASYQSVGDYLDLE